jgi:hypothetical protein
MIGNGANGRAGERGIGTDSTRLAKEDGSYESTRSKSPRSGV